MSSKHLLINVVPIITQDSIIFEDEVSKWSMKHRPIGDRFFSVLESDDDVWAISIRKTVSAAGTQKESNESWVEFHFADQNFCQFHKFASALFSNDYVSQP
ncbi:hypothetical protein M3Y94_00080000 [Aphelenchoides besseyi]|nr:hypothetical protein M3Y94_00080000 [Aphelenchoides besseyi]KAI6237795.1 hypothetical protein M3Y95_00302500 [Aphelenchoides besseyi]